MLSEFHILQITLQALSAFAIAGGLLYTAFQFREARKAESFRAMLENPAMKILHDDFDAYVRALIRRRSRP
jgi:hypothetical protein